MADHDEIRPKYRKDDKDKKDEDIDSQGRPLSQRANTAEEEHAAQGQDHLIELGAVLSEGEKHMETERPDQDPKKRSA